MDAFVAGLLQVSQTSKVVSQYTSEANLSEWLNCASSFLRAPLPYVQAAILNPSLYTECYCTL